MSRTSKTFADVSKMRAPLPAWRYFNASQRDRDFTSGARAVPPNGHGLQLLF
ncbi:hypothetical protein [Pandoraea sp.]|uniref:hypothetical protein n=1 Tax=Pandoraea sp. TaxID=1883445 RepID=UPI0025EB4FFF|nr:hypothetical protein [Pandoraea sp.]